MNDAEFQQVRQELQEALVALLQQHQQQQLLGVHEQLQEDYDPTMRLTLEEIRNAHAIKVAVESDDALLDLTDYEYACYAIVCQDNLDDAMTRIQGMQSFREEYDIPPRAESAEMGLDALLAFCQQQPQTIITVEYVANYFINILDKAKWRPTAIKTDADYKVFFRGTYFLSQLLQGNLLAVREGVVLMFECDGMTWENFCPRFQSKLWYNLMSFYPMHCKNLYLVHSSVASNLLHALMKTLKMGSFVNNAQMGDICDPGYRLDEVYNTPTPEIAFHRLMERLLQFLKTRYHHQATYKLPAYETTMESDSDDDDDADEIDDEDDDEEDVEG